MTVLNPTQCAACDRLRGYTCAAYPDGIIDHFTKHGGDHRHADPGDRGFHFIQKDTDEARQAFDYWQTFWQPADSATEAETSVAGVKGAEKLHAYWTRGKGLGKWADEPKPYTALYSHLVKFMDPDEAHRTAEVWFEEIFHFAPGSDLNRVTHGKPPRGKVIGPG